MNSQATPDETIVVCVSRQIHDNEVVAQGIATPLVAAGYLLARKTHAPNLYFVSAIGQGICRNPAPLSISKIENFWLDRALTNVGFVFATTEALPILRPKEFFRPAQLDPHGNFNNIAFGKDYINTGRHHPRLRLPGSGGIPDVTTFIDDICLYVPRHSRAAFTEPIDFVSGLGHAPHRVDGAGPMCLISNLGQFDFARGRMRLTTYHAGESVEKIQAKTGFPLDIAPGAGETEPPTAEEVRLLREVIDPLSVRRLELLSGAQRKQLIRDVLRKEGVL